MQSNAKCNQENKADKKKGKEMRQDRLGKKVIQKTKVKLKSEIYKKHKFNKKTPSFDVCSFGFLRD